MSPEEMNFAAIRQRGTALFSSLPYFFSYLCIKIGEPSLRRNTFDTIPKSSPFPNSEHLDVTKLTKLYNCSAKGSKDNA